MRVRLKGINSKRKQLADGSLKTYYYAWKGGPPLRGKPGSPEFVASYNAAISQKVTRRRLAYCSRCCFAFRKARNSSLEYRPAPVGTILNRLNELNAPSVTFPSKL